MIIINIIPNSKKTRNNIVDSARYENKLVFYLLKT